MADTNIYEDIALRTDGDIYLGVVGPVRTGKSTFIKRFMETLVIPNIDNVYVRERARDELPQSGSGKTIMTAEPKFVPEDAVTVTLDEGVSFSLRLIDCVGYMVNGAIGQFEGESERMVTTPWFDHEITMTQAAEEGTHKVIAEHSTIGLVITTDGSICGIDRQDYIEPEERVINELREIGKPFVIILNCAEPGSAATQELRAELEEKYGASCMAINCLELSEADITRIMRGVLYEFPVTEVSVFMPSWVDALPIEHELRQGMFATIGECARDVSRIKDIYGFVERLNAVEGIGRSSVRSLSLGSGAAFTELELPRSVYFETISGQSGFEITDDGDLMELLTEFAGIKKEYDRIAEAMQEVREKGYGIVMPTAEEMKLEEPEIVNKAGKYSVRLKASAPSIHMIKANIVTEVSPALGGATASEEIINFLIQGFDGDVNRIWESNIFGKSLYDIAEEGLSTKARRMPEDAQGKLQETLQRIINEGSGGLICIIL